MACYVATELGKLEASPRIENKAQYIVSRIMGCVRLVHTHTSHLIPSVTSPSLAHTDPHRPTPFEAAASQDPTLEPLAPSA